MLEKLSEINWDQLTYAFGSASHLPDTIKDLTSNDEGIREDAIDGLYSSIWHQGTVYEATAYAVPFLVELLESPEIEDKHQIVGLLREIANGELSVNQYRSGELDWLKAAREAVVKHYDIYLNLTVEGDEKTRSAAIKLLTTFEEKKQRTLPHLQSCLENETTLSVKAAVIFTLPLVASAYDQKSIDLLLPYLSEEQEPVIRLFAAQTVAALAREKTPFFVQEILVDAFKEDEFLVSQYRSLSWIEDDILSKVGDSLSCTNGETAKLLIPELINVLEASSFCWRGRPLVKALMGLLFGPETLSEHIKGTELSELQRQVLSSIGKYALEDIRRVPTHRDLTIETILRGYGLPSTLKDLEAFLGT